MRLALLPLWLTLVASLAVGSAAKAMTFDRVTAAPGCAERLCIAAQGEIDADTVRDFRKAIRGHERTQGGAVYLHSEGGDLLQGLALGGELRKAGFATRVQRYDGATGTFAGDGVCASACAYAFLGGVARTLAPDARYGLHQLHAPYGALSASDTQALAALIAVHVQRMGGGMDLLICALRTPPHRMHWLSQRELVSFGVITTDARSDAPMIAGVAERDARREG